MDNNALAQAWYYSNMLPDTTLDTNSTANTSWLGTQHSFTVDQNFTNIGASSGAWINGDLNVSGTDSNMMRVSAETMWVDGNMYVGNPGSAGKMVIDFNGTALIIKVA